MNPPTGEAPRPKAATPPPPVERRSTVAAILTDPQFWIPVAVLAIGLGLLADLS